MHGISRPQAVPRRVATLLVLWWSLLICCISKQFQYFHPVQDTTLFPLTRLQDTFFSPLKKPPSTAYDFFFLSLFCNIYKGQFLMEVLAGLSCLPWHVGGSFFLGILLQGSSGTPLCSVRPARTGMFGTSLHLSVRGPQVPQHIPRPKLESSPWITSLHYLFPTNDCPE